MSRLAFHARTLALPALGVAAITLAAVTFKVRTDYDNIAMVVCVLAAGLVAYLASLCVNDARQKYVMPTILLVAVIVRVIAILDVPLVSTDIYRYVWDGHVQSTGINPYLYVPADPALSSLQDEAIYPKINRADYAHTAYPPVAQMFFWLATRLGYNITAMRLAFLLCEAVIIAAIFVLLKRMGKPPALVVAYAWHPMAIWETANAGHIDALASMLIILSLVALLSGRRLVGAALIALSILVKPYAIILAPAFWRMWDWRAPVLVIGVVTALYLPYLSAGTAVIGFIPGYFQEEGLDTGSAFWLVLLARYVFGNVPGLEVVYVLLGFATFTLATIKIIREQQIYDAERQYGDAMVLLAIGLFFLSPNYSWYYLPLVPFVALGGGPTLWAMTLGAMVLNASWDGMETNSRFLLLKSIMNLGWMLVFLVTCLRGKRPHNRKAEALI